MNTYNVSPKELKYIRPTSWNPALSHKRPFTVSIAANKDTSVIEDTQAKETVKIYLDGSSLNSCIAAVATLYRDREVARTLHYHLRPSTEHTVHEAELIGILLDLHLIKTEKKSCTSHVLGVDNQPAQSSLQAVKMAPGQYITNTILETALQIKKMRNSANYSLRFRWTAGHVGIKGNKEVDAEAKKAAEGMTSSIEDLLPLLRKKIKTNKSALKQQRRSRLKARWSQEWKTSPRYNKMSAIDPSFPSNNFSKLISDDCLSRVDVSCICQLRTGHIPLNA